MFIRCNYIQSLCNQANWNAFGPKLSCKNPLDGIQPLTVNSLLKPPDVEDKFIERSWNHLFQISDVKIANLKKGIEGFMIRCENMFLSLDSNYCLYFFSSCWLTRANIWVPNAAEFTSTFTLHMVRMPHWIQLGAPKGEQTAFHEWSSC